MYAPLIIMFMNLNIFLNLLVILTLCASLNVQTFTKPLMDSFKQYPDYTHHFIFFNRATLNSIQDQLEIWDHQQDIRFYINDCASNKLPECETSEQTPLLLIFNRVLIKYNSDPHNLQDLIEWIESRIVKKTHIIHTPEQLETLISTTPNVYCFCTSQMKQDDQAAFLALAKSLPFLNYCIIQNQILHAQLGLKAGNLTYIKNSTSNRVEFTYPNRLDAWEWFIKANMLHTLPRVQDLSTNRFQQKEKNLQIFALTCDLSFACEKAWQKVRDLESQLNKQNLGFDFYISLQDQKQSFTFNLYYHLTFNMPKLPAFIHIDLKSTAELAGNLTRHIEYTSKDFTIKALTDFKNRVLQGEVEPFYFSDEIPNKNGFTGKGSEKLIQKLVAKNLKQTIQSSPNHYFLLVTAVEIGCSQCESFYKEYKQIASLLREKDVTFGFINVNKNQIDIQQVSRLPELLLFKKDDKANPKRLEVSHIFNHFRNFIRSHLGDSYADPDEL